MADDEDPYVVYQLRKPHQRGTAVVPRLVPKSHAPAFSHANYRFTRVRPAADDSLLYLPKSLEYPTKWDSFGSESSIWSGSSMASAFPNRVSHLLDQPTAGRDAGSRAHTSKHIPNDDEETISSARASSNGRGAPSVASLTERTSILSSEGTRSLKSFIRFDAPFNAEALGSLQAPVPIRRPFVAGGAEFGDPFVFVLPPALSEVEREDQIVQRVMENPSSVSSETESSDFGGHGSSMARRAPARKRMESSDLLHPSSMKRHQEETMRRQSPSTATRKRRSMWAWLFGGGERERVQEKKKPKPRPASLRKRHAGDVRVAPIMDEEEEKRRRAQFVNSGRRTKSSSNRFGSWKRSRSESVDGRPSKQSDRASGGMGRPSSARRLWNSFKRSASFTFGSKRNLQVDEEEPRKKAGDRAVADVEESKRQDSTLEDEVGPNDSFVKRKIASLRETTSRRMAAAASEIGKAPSHQASSHSSRRKDPAVHPRERREDRPRSARHVSGVGATALRHSISGGRTPGISSLAPGATMSTLDQMIAARPELQSATSESVENLASRINSDLSYGTGFTSMSERTDSTSAFKSGPFHFDGFRQSYEGQVRDPAVHSSVVSSAPSSDAFSESSFRPSLQAIVCEEAPSPISQWRSPSRGNSISGRTDSGSTELRLSNASKRSIEMMRARVGSKESSQNPVAAQNSSFSPLSASSPGKRIFHESESLKKQAVVDGTVGKKQGDFSDPHATQLDVYCQCSCSCVYEEDCIQGCEGKSGKSSSATGPTLSIMEKEERLRSKSRMRDIERVRQLSDYSSAAESPSLSVVSGVRAEIPVRNISQEDWQHTLRKRFPMSESDNSYESLGGNAGSSDPPLHSVEEIRGTVRNPKGFSFESGRGNDWTSRYGKGQRTQERAPDPVPAKSSQQPWHVEYKPQRTDPSKRVSTPVSRSSVPLLEEFPSVQYRSGVPVQRIGGDPHALKAGRTRRADLTPVQLRAGPKSPLSHAGGPDSSLEQPSVQQSRNVQSKQRPGSLRTQQPMKQVQNLHEQQVSSYQAVHANDVRPDKPRSRPRAADGTYAAFAEEGSTRRNGGSAPKPRGGRTGTTRETQQKTGDERRRETGRYARERTGKSGATDRVPASRGQKGGSKEGTRDAEVGRTGRGLVGMFIRK